MCEVYRMTCVYLWEGGSVWEHARRRGEETRPDPAAAGSMYLIRDMLIQFLYPAPQMFHVDDVSCSVSTLNIR